MRDWKPQFSHRGGDAFSAANPDVDDVTIRLTPERWRSADFSKSDNG
jgi:hypothetical protein